MPEQSNDYRIIVFGADSVGKSSLVLRFVKGTFSDAYVPTVEDTYQQVISCNRNVCTLQITDCSGSHQFPAMQQLNINKGHAFMLVYSITSRQSLEALVPIYEQIRELKGDGVSVPIIIVGNKSDEESKREVKKELASKITAERLKDCALLETSAKLDINVQQAFQELLSLDKTRTMSLKLDLKKSRAHLRKEKLKSKCSIT